MSTRKSEHASPMVSIYDGQRCVGFVLARGRSGFEAFDAGERSLGGVRDAECGDQQGSSDTELGSLSGVGRVHMNTNRKSPIETTRVIAQLFDRYGIDRSLDRDRSQDGERFELALSYAARDGLLQLPHKRGAPSKWKGKLGLELVQAIESLQVRAGLVIPKNTSKLALQETIESLRAGRAPTIRLKPLSIPKAIRALQDQYPDKWGAHDDLEKRYYEAKNVWNYARRLKMFADRWHPDHPENS
jgi:hypothetical protein